MAVQKFKYAIIGGGLAGASAIEGIRELDDSGSILLISREKHLPYHRPPLTKQLWSGRKNVEDIYVQDQKFYADRGVQLALSSTAASVDLKLKTVTDTTGRAVQFDKLLLAAGGTPRRLTIPGADLEGLCYFRHLDDYLAVRQAATEGKSAVVIGGGFIGSEIAAALCMNRVSVTMIFPGTYLCGHVFPAELARAMQERYRQHGVRIFAEDRPIVIARRDGRFAIRTQRGQQVESDVVIVGVGIVPGVQLGETAGLVVEDGIVVNEYLQSSHPDVYAAGDNANFPYGALGKRMRVEHWDCALSHGKCAGHNMAGASQAYTYMPYFFSDLFEFGYEAVGEVDSRLETFADWRKQNDTGVVYYLRGGRVRGAMMCNVWDKVDAARQMILEQEWVEPRSLAGAIR
jgi:3-phenylpropionate/trans-cinnamate dioxygenase ferredoxin reductase subunit